MSKQGAPASPRRGWRSEPTLQRRAGPPDGQRPLVNDRVQRERLAPLRVGVARAALGELARCGRGMAYFSGECFADHVAGRRDGKTDRADALFTARHASQRRSAHWRRLEEFLLQPEIDQRFSADAALMRLLFDGR